MVEYITFMLCGILVLGILCQWIAWWIRIPAILFLLLSGLALGPGLHILHPDKLFGDLLFPVVSIAVAIILFEGSLNLKFSELGNVGRSIRNLVSIGYVLTVILTMFAAHYLFHLHWSIALLFGAMTSIGGPTVVSPLLKSIRLKSKLNKILQWESILIDPVGALATVLIFGVISSTFDYHSIRYELIHFVAVIIVGSIVGISFGYGLGKCIQKLWIPEYLTNVATLTTVVLVYSLTDWIDAGGGLLAASLMGITLANLPEINIKEITNFKESLSILMISMLFIILAARVELAGIDNYFWLILIFFAIVQFIIRPIVVWICTCKSDLNWREKTMLSWICPRGITTAAVASLFTFRLIDMGHPGASPMVILSFGIIVTTVIFESLTAKLAAIVLKENLPDPKGIILINANNFSISLARILASHNIEVMMVCKTWHGLIKARAAGVETFYGDALSTFTTERLDTTAYGYLLALSAHHEFNILCCLHYKDSFSTGHALTLSSKNANTDTEFKPLATSSQKSYQRLFEPMQNYSELEDALASGKTIQSYTYPEEDEPDEAILAAIENSIRLIAISPTGMPTPYTTNITPEPTKSWTVLYL